MRANDTARFAGFYYKIHRVKSPNVRLYLVNRDPFSITWLDVRNNINQLIQFIPNAAIYNSMVAPLLQRVLHVLGPLLYGINTNLRFIM